MFWCGKYVSIFILNKSFLKFVTDFGPLAIFFFYYYNNDKNLSVAIPPLIVATLIALAVVWFFEKKIPTMPLVSGILITFFGGLTIYFNDPIFIYVKPTIINILFALALFFGKYFTKEPVLKKIMGKSIPLTNGIGGIFFSKNQTTDNAIKVATISGGIATDKFLSLL